MARAVRCCHPKAARIPLRPHGGCHDDLISAPYAPLEARSAITRDNSWLSRLAVPARTL